MQIIFPNIFLLGFVIEGHYYFLSDATTWDLSADGVKDYAFEHDADVSVYDDPVFTYKLKITQDVLDANSGAVYWKIAPQSAADSSDWNAVLGPETNGDESASGVLISENAQAGKITVAGNYVITINMETMDYTIDLKLQPDVLYTPGGANGWSQLNSGWLQLYSDGGYYYGIFEVNDSFKICTENSWDDDVTYGAESADPSLGGALVQPGDNITVAEAGVYWVKVEYDPISYILTDYELVKVEGVGVTGSFAGFGWSSDVVMEAGDYVVTLTLQPGVPSCTVVKK